VRQRAAIVKTTRFLHSLPTLLVTLLAIAPVRIAEASINKPSDEVTLESASPELWLVNTRCLPCPRNQHGCAIEPAVRRLEACRWMRSSLDEFVQTLSPRQIVCVYIHGNRMSPRDAIEQGMSVYRRVACRQIPLRFVIWSWPSDRIHGVVRDAQVKAARSDGEGFYLACLLARLPSETPVSLLGYSYGARTVTGSLHLLAGGSYCGNFVPTEGPAATVRPRAVLVAAAMPNGWISPSGNHGLALAAADRMLSFYNTRDPALKLYPLSERNHKTRALGYRGISSRCLGPYSGVLRQCRVDRTVGCSHDLDRYTSSASIMSTIRQYALWDEVP
jgi:hypothetical protein